MHYSGNSERIGVVKLVNRSESPSTVNASVNSPSETIIQNANRRAFLSGLASPGLHAPILLKKNLHARALFAPSHHSESKTSFKAVNTLPSSYLT